MATITEPAETEAALATEYPPHRMTVERYERLAASGVYGDKEPVFLWRGRLVEKMGQGQPHVFVMISLTRLFGLIVPEGWFCLNEQPIVVGEDSMPEPDLSVVRGTPRDYLKRRSTARDVCLIVEVSDSSLRIDSGEVLKVYAAGSIPIYWIVNIPQGQVEVYSDPTGPSEAPTYRRRQDYGLGDEVPVILDGAEVGRIAAREFLP